MKQSDNIFVLDDRHEIFNLYRSQCATCKHYQRYKYSCSAFPKGIPDSILEGNEKHDTVIPGQAGKFIYAHYECLSNN